MNKTNCTNLYIRYIFLYLFIYLYVIFYKQKEELWTLSLEFYLSLHSGTGYQRTYNIFHLTNYLHGWMSLHCVHMRHDIMIISKKQKEKRLCKRKYKNANLEDDKQNDIEKCIYCFIVLRESIIHLEVASMRPSIMKLILSAKELMGGSNGAIVLPPH